jgi:hypothetical protein
MNTKINFPEIVRRESRCLDGYFTLRCRLFSAWKMLAKNTDLYQIRLEDGKFALYQSLSTGDGNDRFWYKEAGLPGYSTVGDYLDGNQP